MASSMTMTMTTSFFGGAVATKPATVATRPSQLAVRASMDLEKVVAAAAETTNTRRGLVLAGMAAAAASSVAKAAMADVDNKVGGWTPLPNPSAPEIVNIAGFAVSEHNKEAKTSLVLDSVLKGYTQVVNGLNYRLILSAKDERPKPNNYEAIVYSKDASLQLTSFKPLLL